MFAKCFFTGFLILEFRRVYSTTRMSLFPFLSRCVNGQAESSTAKPFTALFTLVSCRSGVYRLTKHACSLTRGISVDGRMTLPCQSPGQSGTPCRTETQCFTSTPRLVVLFFPAPPPLSFALTDRLCFDGARSQFSPCDKGLTSGTAGSGIEVAENGKREEMRW